MAKTNARAKKVGSAVAAIPAALGLVSGIIHGGGGTSMVRGAPSAITAGIFSPVCSLPFGRVRNPPADDHCGIQGGSSDPAKQDESRAKNNFCAAMGVSQVVTYRELIDLQAQSVNMPKSIPNRQVVRNLGEGKYVSYIALIRDAHYSDVAAGEAVNCNIPGSSTNDIHIVLMPDPNDTDECHSTTAEISPHYRPASWTPENLRALGKPVRVDGQLFYDGSHTPCSGSSRPNPKRASLWEIHPVYSLEVCEMTDLNQCRNSTNPADWTPLDTLLSSEHK